MNFKKWIISEIQHISLQRAKVNGILTDGIDFRFEDYSLGFNPDKGESPSIKPMPAKPFYSGSFSAPLDDGNFMNISYQDERGSNTGSLALAIGQKTVSISSQPEHRQIPSYWSRFAVFYLGNAIAKPPEWPRDDIEKGKMATTIW